MTPHPRDRRQARSPEAGALDVIADLVVKLATGETILIACVRAERGTGLRAMLDHHRPGGTMASGTACWKVRWRDDHAEAVELDTRLDGVPPLPVRLRFALPARARTLACGPTQVAVTDPPGFAKLEQTHRLPWGVLLPEAPTGLLTELFDRAR